MSVAETGRGLGMTTAVQRFYRTQALIYDQTRWTILHGRARAVQKLDIQQDSSVLEIGCGTGLSFPHVTRRLHPDRGSLVGLDFSPDMLQKAERRVARAGWKNVRLVCQDASGLALERKFDRIFFAYSLSMIPQWEQALARACMHLADEGILVVHDFGDFAGWGVFGRPMRAWLRWNHVEPGRPWATSLQTHLPRTEWHRWFGGYGWTLVARR